MKCAHEKVILSANYGKQWPINQDHIQQSLTVKTDSAT